MMRLGATFSADRIYRYRLLRIWREDHPPLMWVMLNPSTADETRDDPTIHRCIGYSLNGGYGGAVIHNIFAFRSTDPKRLSTVNDPVGPDTDAVLREDAARGWKIVCAWGRLGKFGWRATEVLKILPAPLYCLATTKDGSPAHPLYLSSKLRPAVWVPPTVSFDAQ